MASPNAATSRRRRRRPTLLWPLLATSTALAPVPPRWRAGAPLRRAAGCAALAVGLPLNTMAPALAALNPNLGTLDPNGANQGVVIGMDEDAPFRAALGQIKTLLDTLGVEGTVAKIRPKEEDGPIIQRPYEVGLTPGTDRLQRCPSTGKCLSGTRGEKKFTPPFVFFDQKGDAVGNLLELLYSAADATVLTAKGNFFNGAGVYVLAELYDGTAVFDVEFQFLPGVLENIVEARILARENAQYTTEVREKELLQVFGKALGWLPLDAQTLRIPGLTDEEKGIISTSALEIKYREQFEAEMEKADQAVREQMARDQKKIEDLKRNINQLLDSISLSEAARYDEFRDLQSRTARARADYEEGTNKRIGGVANDGRYAASQKIQLGNSFSGLINSKDDVREDIRKNIQQDESGTPIPSPKNKFFGK